MLIFSEVLIEGDKNLIFFLKNFRLFNDEVHTFTLDIFLLK